ncbi:MAG: 4-phosphoerythronate dehydrogenase PdxB [Bacteroidales bacterium]|nr:4-phosphoerythronate dehydrogenase PdxB [Bacteroidales bacterium]
MKIVADDKIPFLRGALEPFAEVHYFPGKEITKDLVKDADALITRTRTQCNQALLEDTNVKLIATATIGYDHIDTDYCSKSKIHWKNAPGCNSGSVMQYVASALVKLSVKHSFEFTDKTLGIVGYGNVGSKVAKMAKAMGFKVLLNDPPLHRAGLLPESVSYDELKEKADLITFHVPLNKSGQDKTHHIADAAFFNSLKPQTIIINSSRGSVVDNVALKQALKQKQIGGAVLDVWEAEPNLDLELLGLVDFATPHIAGYSADGKANGTAMSVQAISAYFGFEVKNWFPSNVPLPKKSELYVLEQDKDQQTILSKLILETYDIEEDHKRLIQSPETFEKQRGDYPIRREFMNYTVIIKDRNPFLGKQLKNLGFNIK